MKYVTLNVSILSILFGIYFYHIKNSPTTAFDVSKAREIEKEVLYRKQNFNNNAYTYYLDSLSKNINNDIYNEYFQFINILKIKLDTKISNDEKIGYLLELIESASFRDQHEYIRYKTRYELSYLYISQTHYDAALEQNILATQCIESKFDVYCLEMAELYRDLGYLAASAFENFEQSKTAYQHAQKAFEKMENWRSSAVCMNSLALCAYMKTEYDTAILYTNLSISEYKKFTSDPNCLWSMYYPILFNSYQKSNKIQLAYAVYNEAIRRYSTKQINTDSYISFLVEILENMIEIGNYDEAERIIVFIEKASAKTCEQRYRYCMVYRGIFFIAKAKNDKMRQKEALLKVIHYCSECGRTNPFFEKCYNQAIENLIQLDKELGNNEDVIKWYNIKINLYSHFKQQNKLHSQHINALSKMNENYMNRKIDEQESTIMYRYFIIGLFCIIFVLLVSKITHFSQKIEL